jgi:hypothetical protein
VSLVAFGTDRVIEIASAAVLIWRLVVVLRRGQAFAEDAEAHSEPNRGCLLFALAAYLVAAACRLHDLPGRGLDADPDVEVRGRH